jgi:hypothetical protein
MSEENLRDAVVGYARRNDMIKNMSGAPDEALHMKHREYTAKFAEIMARQLTDHRHIGIWRSYKPTKEMLQNELVTGHRKLLAAIKSGEGVQEKAADLANFCSKAVEMFGKVSALVLLVVTLSGCRALGFDYGPCIFCEKGNPHGQNNGLQTGDVGVSLEAGEDGQGLPGGRMGAVGRADQVRHGFRSGSLPGDGHL